MKTPFKLADIIVIAAAAGIVFFSAFTVYIKPAENTLILVRGQDSEWTFPADAKETIAVSGPLGETIIRIGDNCAWVESSPCDNQNCVAAGRLFRQGQWAACLPNNVLLMLHGKEGDDVGILAW
ncbi:MAG: NusG domain II-containing protein [Treponema sp.]|jgi:hypothetical protein|nr:NusG domain II-containing protein [Treponema sp.]